MMKVVQWTKAEVKLNKKAQSVQLENLTKHLLHVSCPRIFIGLWLSTLSLAITLASILLTLNLSQSLALNQPLPLSEGTLALRPLNTHKSLKPRFQTVTISLQAICINWRATSHTRG